MLQAWVHGCQSRLPTTAATACANKIFQKSSLKLLMVNKIFRNKLEKIWRDQLNCDFSAIIIVKKTCIDTIIFGQIWAAYHRSRRFFFSLRRSWLLILLNPGVWWRNTSHHQRQTNGQSKGFHKFGKAGPQRGVGGIGGLVRQRQRGCGGPSESARLATEHYWLAVRSSRAHHHARQNTFRTQLLAHPRGPTLSNHLPRSAPDAFAAINPGSPHRPSHPRAYPLYLLYLSTKRGGTSTVGGARWALPFQLISAHYCSCLPPLRWIWIRLPARFLMLLPG
jgi:hypothetical protein